MSRTSSWLSRVIGHLRSTLIPSRRRCLTASMTRWSEPGTQVSLSCVSGRAPWMLISISTGLAISWILLAIASSIR